MPIIGRKDIQRIELIVIGITVLFGIDALCKNPSDLVLAVALGYVCSAGAFKAVSSIER